MKLFYRIFATPIGELLVAGNADTVTHLEQDADKFLKDHCEAETAESGSVVSEAACSILAYLRGHSHAMRIPFDAKGTAFQKSVWHVLSSIPLGETRSYTEIAEALGKPSAYRAVANACGRNPVPLLIPCHRAVHKGGNVSGFAWGVDVKRQLLALEQDYIFSSRKAA